MQLPHHPCCNCSQLLQRVHATCRQPLLIGALLWPSSRHSLNHPPHRPTLDLTGTWPAMEACNYWQLMHTLLPHLPLSVVVICICTYTVTAFTGSSRH
jgi:hypothetical protein